MEEETQAKPKVEEAASPRRRCRWLYLLAGAMVLLPVMAMVGWFAVLPKMVEKRLKDSLRELGFSGVELRVDRLGMSRARLSDIRLGGERPIVIGEVMAEYRLGEAIDGVMRNVVIEGLKLEAVQKAHGIRFPQLEKVSLPESDETLHALPFESIRIVESALALTGEDGAARRIPFYVSLNKSQALEMGVELATPKHKAESRAKVGFLDGNVVVREGRLSWNTGMVSIPMFAAPLTEVSMALSFEGEVVGGAGSFSILPGSSVSAQTGLWRSRDGVEARDVAVEMSVTGKPWVFKDGGLEVGGYNGKVVVDQLRWENVDMKLVAHAGSAEVFAGEEGLRVRVLPGTEVDWRPSRAFLARNGVVADGVRATLRELKAPTELNFPGRGDWAVTIPEGRLDVRGDALEMADGNFTAESLTAALNIRADIGAERGGIQLRPGSTLETGVIQHRVFEDVSPMAIRPALFGLESMAAKPALSWPNLDSFELNVILSSKVVAAKQGGLRLSAAPLELGIAAAPSRVALAVAEQSRTIVVPDPQWLARHGVKAEELRLAARDFSGPIVLQRTLTGDVWTLETPLLWLDMDAKALELPKVGLSLDSLKTSLRLKADFDEQGPIVNLQSPAELIAGSVKTSGKRQAVEVKAGRWRLTPADNEPELELTTRPEGGVGVVFNGRLDGTGVIARTQDGTAEFKRVSFAGKYIGEKTNTLVGHMEVEDGLIDFNDTRVSLNVGKGSLILEEDTWLGNCTIDGSQLSGIPLFNIQGLARSVNGGVQFSASSDLVEDLRATLAGSWTGDGLRAKLIMPPKLITDAQALGRRFKLFQNLEINGTAGLEVTVDQFSNGRFLIQTLLLLQDAAVTSADLGIIAEGISGTVNLQGLPAQARLTTLAPQRITVRRARLGMLDLINGVMDFQMTSKGVVVDAESWSLARDPEGRFRARDIRLIAGQPAEATVEVDRLDLGIWLGLLTGGRVEATGKLSGRVPVTMAGGESNLPVRVGDGAFLKTAGPGKLQFKSAQWAGEWLESVDPRFKSDPVLKQLRQGVVEALQDFTYSSIEFSYDAKADRMRVAVRGQGKTDKGQIIRFDPTLNIQPVASWVNDAYNELVLLAHLENLVQRDLDNLFGN